VKSRIKMLKKIRQARERIRDIASAELALVERRRERCADEQKSRISEREEIIAQADNRLKIVEHVAEIEILGLEIGTADEYIEDAEKRLETVRKERCDAAKKLRGRERELRLSERLLSDTRKEVSIRADKQEQSMVDDIIASRWSALDE